MAASHVLEDRLVTALDAVESVVGQKAISYWDLAFPAGAGPMVGSEIGRQVWDTPAFETLIDFLLDDPAPSEWFKRPPSSDFRELSFHIASFVDKWIKSGIAPREFCAAHTEGFYNSVSDPRPVCVGIMICQDITISENINLPFGFALRVADREWLLRFPERFNVPEKYLFRLPDKPTTLLIASSTADRNQFRGLAGTLALGNARVGLHKLWEALWLATSVVGVGTDEFFVYASPFPPGAIEHIPAPPEKRIRKTQTNSPPVIADDVRDVLLRHFAYFGPDSDSDEFDEDTWLSLWMVEALVHLVLSSSDPLAAILWSYAGIDRLLRNRDDDDAWLSTRVACLVGRDDNDRRAIRRFLARIRNVRGVAAHGGRPHLRDLALALDKDVTQEEIESQWLTLRDELYSDASAKIIDLLRRCILAYLWLTTDVGESTSLTEVPAVSVGLTRSSILDLLDRCGRNEAASIQRIREKVTPLARDEGALP